MSELYFEARVVEFWTWQRVGGEEAQHELSRSATHAGPSCSSYFSFSSCSSCSSYSSYSSYTSYSCPFFTGNFSPDNWDLKR